MVGQPLEPFAIVRAIAVVRAFSRSLDEAARADRTSAPQHIEVYDILRFDREGHPKSRGSTDQGRTTHETRMSTGDIYSQGIQIVIVQGTINSQPFSERSTVTPSNCTPNAPTPPLPP